MRILLDESLPQKLRYEFGGEHDVFTVQYKGWLGKKNGELLKLMTDDKFDLFITVDRNLTYQQNLEGLNLTIIVLCGPDNRPETLKPLIPKLLDRIVAGNLQKVIEIS
jgi:hypothetical protein